jgi:hypothetical protein
MKNITNTHQEHPITLEDTIGRDPREFTREVWEDLDFELQPMKAIRAKCIECCGGYRSEVPKCQVTRCSLYALRMGHRPQAKPKGWSRDSRYQSLASEESGDIQGSKEVDNEI